MKLVPALPARKSHSPALPATLCAAHMELRVEARRGHTGEAAPEPTSDQTTAQARALRCAACAAVVTTVEQRIAVNGAVEHRFLNPAGVLFHVGCFAEAIGCTIVGPDSLEYPWFPGFSWRYAMCAACTRHLGWHFRSDGKPSFFALILDRLTP